MCRLPPGSPPCGPAVPYLQGDPLNGQTDLRTVVLLGGSAAVCYLAYRRPDIGVALLVGIGFAALLHILMR